MASLPAFELQKHLDFLDFCINYNIAVFY